jgi:hypothetical protein
MLILKKVVLRGQRVLCLIFLRDRLGLEKEALEVKFVTCFETTRIDHFNEAAVTVVGFEFLRDKAF